VEQAQKRLPFHFAVLERTGLASFGVLDDVREADRCTAERGGVDKSERVADLALAAQTFRSEPWAASVLVAGHSEGADVASGAARALGPCAVAAVGFFASGGVSQFVDLVLEGRRRGDAAAAQGAFDDLLALTGPQPPTAFQGYPRMRFASFAIASTPLDDLVGLDVPVFIVQGTADTNSAPESADVLAVELLRRDAGRAVRYVVLDHGDHGFHDRTGGDHGEELLVDFVRWAEAPTRSVQTRSFARSAGLPTVRFLRMPAWVLAGIAFAVGAASLALRRRATRAVVRFGASVFVLIGLVGAGATLASWFTIATDHPDPTYVVTTGEVDPNLRTTEAGS